MIHGDAKSLRSRGDKLFSDKHVIDSRNQDIAEQFYVERADFSVKRSLGDDFAEHLVTGYPSMVRRDLANSLGAMLRPRGKQWFHIKADREDRESHEARGWLEWATKLQWRAMSDRVSQFARATKEGDHDFATFGSCAISVEMNLRDQALLYRCWHLRDMAWAEDSYGQIGQRHRNWQPTVGELCGMRDRFNLSHKVYDRKDNSRDSVVNVRHICVSADEYGWRKTKHPWVSVFIDCDNDHLMYEAGSWTSIYVTPRWGTMSVNPYGVSPATVIALPDARLLQAMTLTMIDTAERAANPPMIGVSEAIRGDLAFYPGGFTAVDAAYDERLGEVLRPLTQDKSALPFGLEMLDRTGQMLKEAFYLNTLQMPGAGDHPQMTAFEVGQRVQEYIRNAMPVFEPMEAEYNAALCDITFETLMRNGAFGSPREMPRELQGSEVQFAFESPLSDMVEREKGQRFLEMKSMLAEAISIDQEAANIPKVGEALRDVLSGIGVPAKWLHSPTEIEQKAAQDAAAQEAAQILETMQAGANVAKTTSEAAQGLGVAGII